MMENSALLGIVSRLKDRSAGSPLMPDHAWDEQLDLRIAQLSEVELAAGNPGGLLAVRALKAVLHLWNDSLDASHELSQEVETQTGSVLHGIMHRREGDFSNAKYWFRLAGEHPVYEVLQQRALACLKQQDIPDGTISELYEYLLAEGRWNPYLFTDAAAAAARGQEPAGNELLEDLQRLELELLLASMADWPPGLFPEQEG